MLDSLNKIELLTNYRNETGIITVSGSNLPKTERSKYLGSIVNYVIKLLRSGALQFAFSAIDVSKNLSNGQFTTESSALLLSVVLSIVRLHKTINGALR